MNLKRRPFLAISSGVLFGGCTSIGTGGQSDDGADSSDDQSTEPSRDVRRRVGDELAMDELENRSDRLISDVSGIEALPEEDVSGETIGIAQPETPYRTTRWIDIIGDSITLLFQSPFAEDDNPIITVDDEADVGGVRFGEESPSEDITVINYGYDGNYEGQDQAVEYLNGLHFEAVEDFTVEHAHLQNTSPHHEYLGHDAHGPGGEGINVESECRDYEIRHVPGENIGDQLVQARGENAIVEDITEVNGFDRTVSVSFSNNVTVRNVANINNKDGAVVGLSGASDCLIEGVYGHNSRNVISVSNETHDVEILDVVAEETPHTALDVRDGSHDISITTADIQDINAEMQLGIQVNDGAHDVEFEDISIHSQRGSWLVDLRPDASKDIILRDITLLSDGDGNISRAIRDGIGGQYQNITIDVGTVGQDEEILIQDSAVNASFEGLKWGETIEDNGEGTVINESES